MAKSQLPIHIENLIHYLSYPDEKGNADLIRNYFRTLYKDEFKCETQADNADGYVPGHFILELKSKKKDWFKGLLQGISYKRTLDVTLIVVATNEFLGVWDVKDIPKDILEDIYNTQAAASTVGTQLARKYKDKEKSILKKALWKGQELTGLFGQDIPRIINEIAEFEKILKTAKKVRFKISVSNFSDILKEMIVFFSEPIKAVSAFYSMIYNWDQSSVVMFSKKYLDSATLNGEAIHNLLPVKRVQFKEFVEKYYIFLNADECIDDFFAKYDKAIDSVDKGFRVRHGIYFTDLDLSKYALWFVKQKIPNLGKDYLVIDPACGSGNLVTNWRSPLELRHKVVSEIEPELLFTVENRMKGDSWHNGKYTVVPKIEEGKGLNFIDKSAEEYLEILKFYLNEKGLKANKPIAFLCNPPYRGDDDQKASSIEYKIHSHIIEIIGEDAVAERYNCFLAQMKLISEKAPNSGLPGNSMLLLFTPTGWLSNRPSFQNIKNLIFSSFNFIDGLIVNSREFFDVKGKFPVIFTVWEFNEKRKKLDIERPILLRDLTWVKKEQLSSLPWRSSKKYNTDEILDKECMSILEDKRSTLVPFAIKRVPIKEWVEITSKDFKRYRRKDERDKKIVGGLPAGDLRVENKRAYGELDGASIGFMDDLTPCRIKAIEGNYPWFRLNPQFMDCRKNRCFSGPPTHFGYCAKNITQAIKTFFWYTTATLFSENGYPIWANALELWAPTLNKDLEEEMIKYVFSIGLADNECVETIFPANNPTKGISEVYANNPLAPNNPDSFWSKVMASKFHYDNNTIQNKLITCVQDFYTEWELRFQNQPEIIAPFKKSYFIGNGILRKFSGIIQIKDYADSVNDTKLLELYSSVSQTLKEVKQSYYEFLTDHKLMNYFGQPNKIKSKDNVIEFKAKTAIDSNRKTTFDLVVERRMALFGLIMESLSNDPNLGRTKLAKIFYLADVHNNLNLGAKYIRDAAGPLDSRLFYNKKIGIEHLGASQGYFKVSTGQKTKIKYSPDININDLYKVSKEIFKKQLGDINKIIELFKVLDTQQSEIVATLYACWNDLLIDNCTTSENDIVQEYLNNWHTKKKLIPKDRLLKALKWMKKNEIVPTGKYKMTHTLMKPKKESDLF